MAWFLNHYECSECDYRWQDEWSCMCDDLCPICGAKDNSPVDSNNLTEIVETTEQAFVLLRSSDRAEHHPDYYEVARFPKPGRKIR